MSQQFNSDIDYWEWYDKKMEERLEDDMPHFETKAKYHEEVE